MIYRVVDLYKEFSLPRPENGKGELTVYAFTKPAELPERVRPAMLVFPGGGYGYVSPREGEPVALRFMQEGYQAFVLNYTVNTAYPVPLVEAAMATAYIRMHAQEFCVDPAHVAAVGFSAGGHLAGMLANLFADEPVKAALGENAPLARPDAVILSYAVLSTQEGVTHGSTAETISGGDAQLRRALSLETRVTAESVPAFVWHTAEDGGVPVANSLRYAASCLEQGVPCELHVFEKGWHGLSLANFEVTATKEQSAQIERVQAWVPLAASWLRSRGFDMKEV